MRVNSVVLSIVLALAGIGVLESKLGAQPLTAPVNVTPDCLLFMDFTANGSSPAFDNRFLGCKTWYVAYTSTAFPALTLTLESDTDTNGAPTGGGWVAFAGTVVEGVNPNVALTQGSTILYGYYPWVRITLTNAVPGAGRRLRGTFYGYRQTPVSNVVFPPGALTVTADQGAPNTDPNRWPFYLSDGAAAQGVVANPLFIQLSDGAAAQGTLTNPLFAAPTPVCTSKAAVTLSASGATQVIAPSAGKIVKVCHLSLSAETPVNVQVIEGTGANCVTGPANITGNYRSVLGVALDFGISPLTGSASQALCLSLGAAVNVGGVITYAQN